MCIYVYKLYNENAISSICNVMCLEFGLYTKNFLQVFQTPWLHFGMRIDQKFKI